MDAVLTTYAALVPSVPDDLVNRARAADLWALGDLAARRSANPIAGRAHDQLLTVARSRDLHAVAGWTRADARA